MKFVDRNNEIERLERVLGHEETPKFVIIYGRRRLGKSTLIRHVLRADDLYFMADQTQQSQQLELMAKTIGMKNVSGRKAKTQPNYSTTSRQKPNRCLS